MCFLRCRACAESEQFSVVADPPNGAAHQRQQPEPPPARDLYSSPPRLPQPLLQQAAQPPRGAREHGLSQVDQSAFL